MLIRLVLPFFGLLLVCTGHGAPAQPAYNTVQDLYDECKNDLNDLHTTEDYFHWGSCIRYLTGIAHVQMTIGAMLRDPKSNVSGAGRATVKEFAICDASFSGGSLRQVFLNWAEANPKMWSEPDGVGVMLAFTQAWPCK